MYVTSPLLQGTRRGLEQAFLSMVPTPPYSFCFLGALPCKPNSLIKTLVISQHNLRLSVTESSGNLCPSPAHSCSIPHVAWPIYDWCKGSSVKVVRSRRNLHWKLALSAEKARSRCYLAVHSKQRRAGVLRASARTSVFLFFTLNL